MQQPSIARPVRDTQVRDPTRAEQPMNLARDGLERIAPTGRSESEVPGARPRHDQVELLRRERQPAARRDVYRGQIGDSVLGRP